MKKLFQLIAVISALIPNVLMSQESQFVPSVDQLVTIPGSPEAAAFGKYGNTDISHYSGTPNISIPLANLNGRSYSLPISLTYDASGIRVEQLSTWVGLGWNLNAGGAVTRKVNGLPDDWTVSNNVYYPHYSGAIYSTIGSSHVGYYYDYFITNNMFSGDHSKAINESYAQFMKAFSERKVDVQPDTYKFSINGLNGEFYIDYTTDKGVALNNPELDIDVDLDPGLGTLGGSKVINGFTITDNQGTKYVFNQVEETDIQDSDPSDQRIYNSAWYISSITTANNRDVVNFYYSAAAWWTNEQYLGRGEVRQAAASGTPDCPLPTQYSLSAIPVNKVKQFTMDSIRVNGRTLAKFTLSSADRQDLAGRKSLDEIEIFNSNEESMDVIKFDYDYFVTGLGDTEFKKRLKLEGVSFWGADGAYELDADNRKDYSFDYHAGELPSRDSNGQDFWGYNIGTSLSTMIPEDASLDNTVFTGTNRKSKFSFALRGTLQKITYPTGGTTEFSFQPNFVDPNSPWNGGGSGGTTQTIHYGSGFINGFEDSNDPAGFQSCNDLDMTTEFPAQFSSTFVVGESDNYDMTLEVTNDASTTILDEVTIAVIYEGAEKTLCQIIADTQASDIIYYKDNFTPGSGTQTITQTVALDPMVTYRILLVSNADVIDMEVTRDEQAQGTGFGSGITGREMGSFRIYKIEDRTSDDDVALTKYYYYDDLSTVDHTTTTFNHAFFANSTVSTGILQVPVDFRTRSDVHKQDPNNENVYLTCEYYNRVGSNKYRQNAGIISYSTVTEVVWDNDAVNGFTVYDFVNGYEVTQNMTTSTQLANGRPSQRRIYDDQWEKLQQVDYEYEQISLGGSAGMVFDSPLFGNFNVISSETDGTGHIEYEAMALLGFAGNVQPTGCTLSDDDCLAIGPFNQYQQYTYGIGQFWVRLEKETTTNYDGGTPIVASTQTFYESSNHYEVTKTQTTDSEGNTHRTELFYPGDLSDAHMSTLESEHRTGELIQTTRYKNNGTSDIKLSNQKTTYADFSGKVRPSELKYAVGNESLESRIKYDAYDGFGNPISLTKDEHTSMQYIWGYDGALPIAQINNSNANDYKVAYTSFEEGQGAGGWSLTGTLIADSNLPSGLYYHDLDNGSLTVDGLSMNDTYELTFWAKDGTVNITNVEGSDDAAAANSFGWKFYKKRIGGIKVTISGTAKIDEVRFYPIGAQMTSYTYIPSRGLTTVTGPNGLAMHYEYDDMGRLIKVLDQDWNIVQLKDYKYKETITNPNNPSN